MAQDLPTLQLPPVVAPPAADMSVKELRREILQKGHTVEWHRSAICPCSRVLTFDTRTTTNHEPKADCPECKGRGIVYYMTQEIPALIQRSDVNMEYWTRAGATIVGTASITVLPEHQPRVMDRFVVKDTYIEYSEVRKKLDTSIVEKLRYPVVIRPVITGDIVDPTIPKTKHVAVTYLRKADTSGNVYGPQLEDLVEPTAQGDLDWSRASRAGELPEVGEYFSISYYTNPVYIVVSYPYSQRVTHIKAWHPAFERTELPVNCIAKLEWLGG